MGRMYNYLSILYRFMIVLIFIFLNQQYDSEITDTKIYEYAILIIYAFVFSLFNFNKMMSFVELILVLFYINIKGDPIFYYLLLMPMLNFIGLNLKVLENLLVSVIISSFIYLKTEQIWFTIMVFIAVMMMLIIFSVKFAMVGKAEKEIMGARKKEYNYKKELVEKQMELDNIMKMFVRSKELNEIKKESELLKALVVSSKEFFDAEYSVLYIENKGQFIKKGDYGKVELYDTPEILPVYEIESDIVKDSMMQVIMYLDSKKWAVIRVYVKTTKLAANDRRVKLGFNDVDHEVLLTYVDQVIIKLKELRLQRKTEFLANYDFLTEIPNRRNYMERFEQFKVLSDRNGATFSMLLLDIDHFKKFNDEYGHDVGDDVLRKVAKVIDETIREKYDVVGRLGGEEFAVMLLNPENKTLEVAERIRRRISKIEAIERVTVSIGVVYYKLDGDEWEDLYNKCDKALYRAKENGRNQVVEYRNI